ncbi:hypothetical protein F2P79_017322 [Pimephales promelas]|nr:hypothetical protein F2P79_017322 [Pimephales promelas]
MVSQGRILRDASLCHRGLLIPDLLRDSAHGQPGDSSYWLRDSILTEIDCRILPCPDPQCPTETFIFPMMSITQNQSRKSLYHTTSERDGFISTCAISGYLLRSLSSTDSTTLLPSSDKRLQWLAEEKRGMEKAGGFLCKQVLPGCFEHWR